MDKQAEIKKMSTERLMAKLIKSGKDEAVVRSMTRQELIDEYTTSVSLETEPRAEIVSEQPQSAVELEKWKFLMELKLKEQEHDRLRKRDEEEIRLKEEQSAQELKMKEEEIRLKEQQSAQELKLKEREMKLKELEYDRLRKRDEEELKLREEKLRQKEEELQYRNQNVQQQAEHERRRLNEKDSLVNRIKSYSEAMKNVLWKLPQDASELPSFFEHLENAFDIYGVDQDIKSKLLQMCLHDKAKSLISRLTIQQLDNYNMLKEFLLNEFRVSPVKLREQFFTTKKSPNETYQLLLSKLKNIWMYYLKSRNVGEDFNKLVSLLMADRMKELLPKECLNFILSQEQEDWLDCDKLARAADTYTATHIKEDVKPYRSEFGSSNKFNTIPPQSSFRREFKPRVVDRTREEAFRKGLCFKCQQPGHLSKDCNKPVRVQRNSIDRKIEINKHERLNSEKIIDIHQEDLYQRKYVDIDIEAVESQKALVDGGAEICCIHPNLVDRSRVKVQGKISILGLQGRANTVDVVKLEVQPVTVKLGRETNIAPRVKVWFAIVPELNENVIITPDVVKLLREVENCLVYSVTVDPDKPNKMIDDVNEVHNNQVVEGVSVGMEIGNGNDGGDPDPIANKFVSVNVTEVGNKEGDEFWDMEQSIPPVNDDITKRSADYEELSTEQTNCPSLINCWKWAKEGKRNFFVKDNLLYRQDKLYGHKIIQLCLPDRRVPTVLEMGHDAPFAGHMAFKTTKYRIKLNFWFPEMDRKIKEYCQSCSICQLRAPIKVAHRVPITPIPRDEEMPFTHLVMDCIGPLFPSDDTKRRISEYAYALVVVDKFSRWPMAYPLKTLKATAVCDALLQIFMTFSVPRIISSDCGTNFTSQLTQEFLKRLGCSPRFNTPGHPEAAGLVERCNQSIKSMIYKLAQQNPKDWYKLLPFVLWSLRERPSSTTHVSPYTLIYGTIPRGPLTVLKESWCGERSLPLNIGKKPEEYLKTLKDNLDFAKAYAEYYSEFEQGRYANYYNLRSTDRRYQTGDKVAVLTTNPAEAKFYNRWRGPGVIVKVKSPYSYIVEIDGKRQHVHANKIKKYHERIDQALVSSCSLIREKDLELGSIKIYERTNQDDHSLLDPQKFEHLSTHEQKVIVEVVQKHRQVFANQPGLCKVIEHEIKLMPEFKPKQMRPYKIPELLKQSVKLQIEQMLETGIIVQSRSEMVSPMVCVLKNSGGVRLAIDYRYVNKYSTGDCFPNSDIPDTLQRVGKAKYISCFDAKSGYWQIPMKKESQWLTAFVCEEGVFEFTRMPFGLKSAGNTFIRGMTHILKSIRDFTQPFVDDVAVFSDTWEDHVRHLNQFLDVVQEAGLTLNISKAAFAHNKVKFVGHIIGSGFIEPDRIKLECLDRMKPPTTKKDLRKMIGFFSYFRSFLPMLADTMNVITDLTRKNAPSRVRWEEIHQHAFDKIKLQLKKVTALNTIDFSKEFGVYVDASAVAVGGCLVQWSEDRKELPIAFASKKLTPAQTKWATIEREAFAVTWMLEKFRQWICLSKIIVFSDHNPLKYLTEAAPKSAKLTRWILALQEFNTEFRYCPGSKNVVADFLSRNPPDDMNNAMMNEEKDERR